jgi:GH35 family endo-1,4-beta-xylanase
MSIKRIGFVLIAIMVLFGCSDAGEEPGDDIELVSVTFIMNGGTPDFGTIQIEKGSALESKYMNPRKIDCGFAGWYKPSDLSFNTPYTTSTPIDNNITLMARWGTAPKVDQTITNFAPGSKTLINDGEEGNVNFAGRNNVTKLSCTSSDWEWNVVSRSLAEYDGKLITVSLDMEVYVNKSAKIVWQINNGSGYTSWGGTWTIIAGNDKEPLDTGNWVPLTGSATGIVKQGNGNEGNKVYLSGGGNGGQLKDNKVDIYISNFSMTIADNSAPIVDNPDKITIGGTKDLKPRLNANMTGAVSWVSSDPSKITVNNGVINSVTTSFSTAAGSQAYITGSATETVTITATANGNTQTFTITATTEGQEYITDLPPLKSRFPSTFLLGNIATPGDLGATITNTRLTYHFNALTSENDMKPSAISDNDDPNVYKWTNADKFVKAAKASGIKVIGHTLLWHQQIPKWQQNMASATKAVALAAMQKYITDVVTHFKGDIYSWDVLNEVFEDNGTMRTNNPWFKAIGADFVYEGFLAARHADPKAILYYNDYNTNNSTKATAIRNMVKDANDKYLALPSAQKPAGEAAGRLLIEGIGMQEHHNFDVPASDIRTAINTFKAIGVKVAVSELDVLAQVWSGFNGKDGANKVGSSTVTNNGLLQQASWYAQYMAVYADFIKDGTIERISFWGITDNTSWRSAGLPLLFDSYSKAKPAYYKFVGAIPSTW